MGLRRGWTPDSSSSCQSEGMVNATQGQKKLNNARRGSGELSRRRTSRQGSWEGASPGRRGRLLRFHGDSAYSLSCMRPVLVGKAEPKMVESRSAPYSTSTSSSPSSTMFQKASSMAFQGTWSTAQAISGRASVRMGRQPQAVAVQVSTIRQIGLLASFLRRLRSLYGALYHG